MGTLRRYRKITAKFVVAVQLDLKTNGFTYWKRKGEQKCKAGDWLVDNDGDIYSVDNEVFKKTYRSIGEGKYIKYTPVWAKVATEDGSVITKEGKSHYKKGDYIVYNNQDGTDAYCIRRTKFESMYELY